MQLHAAPGFCCGTGLSRALEGWLRQVQNLRV